jgi:phospholipid/cholesterol/gamma-HCH transport system substrate-binding protein
MNQETKKSLKVGLGVALGIAALVTSIFILGGNNFMQKTSKLFIEFQQAQGLQVGSVVSLAGLTIGNVRELNMAAGRNVILAEIEVDQKYFSRITDHSKIGVRTQGALGDKYIYIDPGEPGGEQIQPGATLFSEFQPDFLEVLSARTNEVGGSAADVIKELNQLLKQFNDKNRSSALMANLVGTSQNLNKLTNEPEIKASLVHLASILNKIDRGDGTLGALVNDSTLHDKLLNFLGESPRNKFLVPLIRESIKTGDATTRPAQR